MTTTTALLDAIRTNAANVRGWTGPMAGYGTGSGAVPWTPAEWAMFPGQHIIIDQSPDGALFAAGKAHVYDMESLAGTPAKFPGLVKARMALGIQWSTGYGTDGTLADAYAALLAAGPHGWFFGRVDCFLADWNLSEAQAAAIVGQQVHGMTSRAVQWASPVTNPNTIVPGLGKTLAQAQVDMSVMDASWRPGGTVPPPPPPPAHLDGQVIWYAAGGLHNRGVISADAGRTWA